MPIQLNIPPILAEYDYTNYLHTVLAAINDNWLMYPLRPFFEIKLLQLIRRTADKLANTNDPDNVCAEFEIIAERIQSLCRCDGHGQHLEIKRVGRVENLLDPNYFWTPREFVPTPPLVQHQLHQNDSSEEDGDYVLMYL